jgi:hypothetical protein
MLLKEFVWLPVLLLDLVQLLKPADLFASIALPAWSKSI